MFLGNNDFGNNLFLLRTYRMFGMDTSVGYYNILTTILSNWIVEWLGYCNIQHKFHEVHTPLWSILNNLSIITGLDTPMYRYLDNRIPMV